MADLSKMRLWFSGPSSSPMLRLRQLSRFRAAAMHLGISATIAAAAVALMLFVWYPQPLFDAMGGKLLLVLIVGVDVAIGPLITLIIFNPQKKELAFDLSVVAVLQLSALIYGVYAMHAGRPVFIAFVEDHFVVVSAAEIEDDLLAKAAHPEFRKRPEGGPMLVAVDMPNDPGERTNLLFASLAGMGVQHLPQYYVPYDQRVAKVLAAAQPLARFPETPSDKSKIEKAVAGLQRSWEDVRFVPVRIRSATLTALVDGQDGRLLITVAASPLLR